MAEEVNLAVQCSEIATEVARLVTTGNDQSGGANGLRQAIRDFGPTFSLVAGLVGAVVAYGLRIRENRKADDTKSKRLASALSGEISAVASHISAFRYMGFFRIILRKFDRGEDIKIPPRYASDQWFITYKKMSSDLGLLPAPFPERIANLYTRLEGIREELRTTIDEKWNDFPIEQKRPTVHHLLNEIRTVLTNSYELRDDLNAYSKGL